MGFFEDKDGTLYPISRISKVTTERHGDTTMHFAHLDDESSYVRMGPGEYENLRQQTAPHFPSGSGYYVLHFDRNSQENDPVHRTPVVAWCICPERGVLPVTVDGVNDGVDRTLPVLFPDGSIQTAFDRSYESIEEFVSENSR